MIEVFVRIYEHVFVKEHLLLLILLLISRSAFLQALNPVEMASS